LFDTPFLSFFFSTPFLSSFLFYSLISPPFLSGLTLFPFLFPPPPFVFCFFSVRLFAPPFESFSFLETRFSFLFSTGQEKPYGFPLSGALSRRPPGFFFLKHFGPSASEKPLFSPFSRSNIFTPPFIPTKYRSLPLCSPTGVSVDPSTWRFHFPCQTLFLEPRLFATRKASSPPQLVLLPAHTLSSKFFFSFPSTLINFGDRPRLTRTGARVPGAPFCLLSPLPPPLTPRHPFFLAFPLFATFFLRSFTALRT